MRETMSDDIDPCFTFAYKLEDQDYEKDGSGMYGMIATINDIYEYLIPQEDLLSHIESFKNQLEKMIGRKVFVFNRQDTEYKLYIEGKHRIKFKKLKS